MTVINMWGPPSSGKSTMAAQLFAEMKVRGYKVELVTEYAKDLVYSKGFFVIKDQLMVFSKQNHKLWKLQEQVDYAIVDSPLPLSIIYAPKDMLYNRKIFFDFIISTFNSYNNVNYVIEPTLDYQEYGRMHSKVEADSIADSINNLLQYYSMPRQTVHRGDIDAILANLK